MMQVPDFFFNLWSKPLSVPQTAGNNAQTEKTA